jgi:signal transduction histidine kinase
LYTGIDYILLSLTDNGAGFDNAQKHEGIGLKNIRNRVGFYDGTVSIFSQPGKGCTLEVKIPL